MLQRAYQDKLLYHEPEGYIHFEPNAKAAVDWIESQLKSEKSSSNDKNNSGTKVRKPLRRRESIGGSMLWDMKSIFYSGTDSNEEQNVADKIKDTLSLWNTTLFMGGVAVGIAMAKAKTSSK